MSGTSTTTKPDPTFLHDSAQDSKQQSGLAIQERQETLERAPKGARLSRKEFESLLDGYYAKRTDDLFDDGPDSGPHTEHARIAGGRMVRNLALASSIALSLGFGLGLYGLSNEGAETQWGKAFNQKLAQLSQVFSSLPGTSAADMKKTKATAPVAEEKVAKPVKTASLVVANATGTVLAGIPLKLSLRTDSDMDLLAVKIMNVPGDAVLTAGRRQADGVWVLHPEDLKKVALVLSSSRKGPLHLDVELVEFRTGELMSPTRQIKVAILEPAPFTAGGL